MTESLLTEWLLGSLNFDPFRDKTSVSHLARLHAIRSRRHLEFVLDRNDIYRTHLKLSWLRTVVGFCTSTHMSSRQPLLTRKLSLSHPPQQPSPPLLSFLIFTVTFAYCRAPFIMRERKVPNFVQQRSPENINEASKIKRKARNEGRASSEKSLHRV